ncbi:MAG TPA: hypothetical protein VMB48_07995, partial [Steroidobacteraceae bacterium]|nr:hypothetical protein [Steroidobacteraceae bacterium]
QTAPVCVIDSPTNDQMFMNTDTVQGHISVSQPLQPDQKLVLIVDGTPHPEAVDGGGGFTISPVDRGTHTVTAQVQGAGGQVLCTSAPVTFNVHQPTLYSPVNPSGAPRPH